MPGRARRRKTEEKGKLKYRRKTNRKQEKYQNREEKEKTPSPIYLVMKSEGGVVNEAFLEQHERFYLSKNAKHSHLESVNASFSADGATGSHRKD